MMWNVNTPTNTPTVTAPAMLIPAKGFPFKLLREGTTVEIWNYIYPNICYAYVSDGGLVVGKGYAGCNYTISFTINGVKYDTMMTIREKLPPMQNFRYAYELKMGSDNKFKVEEVRYIRPGERWYNGEILTSLHPEPSPVVMRPQQLHANRPQPVLTPRTQRPPQQPAQKPLTTQKPLQPTQVQQPTPEKIKRERVEIDCTGDDAVTPPATPSLPPEQLLPLPQPLPESPLKKPATNLRLGDAVTLAKLTDMGKTLGCNMGVLQRIMGTYADPIKRATIDSIIRDREVLHIAAVLGKHPDLHKQLGTIIDLNLGDAFISLISNSETLELVKKMVEMNK
jgi:hypothetical protein